MKYKIIVNNHICVVIGGIFIHFSLYMSQQDVPTKVHYVLITILEHAVPYNHNACSRSFPPPMPRVINLFMYLFTYL
jgi:hypothetical protein